MTLLASPGALVPGEARERRGRSRGEGIRLVPVGPACGRAHKVRFSLTAALVCLLAACGGAPAPSASSSASSTTAVSSPSTTTSAGRLAGVDPEVAAALQEALEEFVAGWVPAGVSAAVLWPDGALWEGAAGFADAPAGVPLAPGDPMVIGSTTKTFTAAVVLQLVEEGVLGLDDAVAPYFPEFGLDGALTVRHLLGHHSGLWNYTSDPGFGLADEALDPWEVVREVTAWGQMFAPGLRFHYSNTNYTLLGLLIGEVTDSTAHAEIRARILEPLGLEDTFMAWYEDRVVKVPPAGGDPGTPAIAGLVTGAYTAGALASTPADLARFGAALFGGELVSPDSLAVMVTPGDSFGEGATYGLGVEILELAGHTVWGHRGGVPGYQSSLFYLLDDGVVVAACGNSTEPGFPELREALIALVG